ncbi:MAG: phosphoglycerate kinase [Candidatus Colwellbacteria bacterium]|nr:phosphoglycerate kinase [Candidatus Colwellbacteria bacterium]
MITLLRVNLDIKNGYKIAKSIRFHKAAEVIAKIAKKTNKLVIISHRDRPKGRDRKKSLLPLKVLLEKRLKRKIIFLSHFNFPRLKNQITEAPHGSMLMLENIRFLPGETKNDAKLAKNLASLGDLFVNDDFATAHRKNASTVGITKYIKSCMGPTFKAEIKALSKAITKPTKPFVLIIGGAKIEDKMSVIKNLYNKTTNILLGGGPANTVLKASGLDIGSSIFEPHMLELAKKLVQKKKIVLPVDWHWNDSKILDIGKKTAENYVKTIKKAKTIIWSGPMGDIDTKRFSVGSNKVARTIAASRGFSIVGGGDTTEVVIRLGLQKRFSFISTGGGAMLEFLAGKRLPAIETLK